MNPEIELKQPSLGAAYFKMHLSIFLWGFTGLLGKFISFNEGILVWYRLLLSSIAIAIILFFRKKWPRIPKKEFFKIVGIGFIVMFHWVTWYGSIKLASISVAMICLSSIALFASVLEPLFNRKRIDYVEVLFSCIAVAGIATIYNSDVSAGYGIVLGVFSALLSATFSIFNRKIASRYEPMTITLIELGSGWFFLTLLMPFYLILYPNYTFVPSISDIVYLLILSQVCTVLTWILTLQALRRVSAYTMGLALNLEPVYGIILAILFAGEGKLMNAGFISGAGLIVITIALHTLYKYRGRII